MPKALKLKLTSSAFQTPCTIHSFGAREMEADIRANPRRQIIQP